MKIHPLYYALFFCFSVIHAQVPVGTEADDSFDLTQIQNAGETIGGGIFSDPSEIEMIDGLDDPLERVKLRDQDTNLVLDMIQAISGRYILRPQNLPQIKINFDSMNVLTKRETLLALESLLAMNGIGITKIDSQFFKAVPASGMNVHVPIWLETSASSLPPSQRIYVKMFYLKYVPAEKMREILNPFATPNVSSLLIFPNANSILITDSLVNLQRMEKIIEKTDFSKDESSFVLQWYTPNRFSAEVLKNEFESKYEAFFKNDFHVKPEFTVPESNDQLGIYSHVLDTSRIKKIIKEMDVEMLNPVQSKLIPLYHASAESVAQTLESFLNISSTPKSSSTSRPQPSAAGKPSAPAAGASSGTATDAFFSPFAKVVADKRSNGIFLSGTESDRDKLMDMISELDTPLPMARIDTIFVMVDLSESKQRGIDALFSDLHWSDNSRIEKSIYTDPGDDLTLGTSDDFDYEITNTLGGKTLEGVVGIPLAATQATFQLQDWKLKDFKWGQIFSLASERKDVRIFSTPSITVIHGGGDADEKGGSGKSKIQILDTRSVGTYQYSGYGTRANPDDPTSSLTDRTAKTELAISNPRIRKTIIDENGTITRGTVFMSVQVTAEKFDETNTNTYEGQKLPSIKTRMAETDLAIRDGQIMVLGGLQEVQLDSTKSRYNLLSDIPYLGEKFFTPHNQKYTPTELMIFIRPTIIDPEDLRLSDKITATNESNIDTMMLPEYTPRFISPRGKVLGIPIEEESNSKPDSRSIQPSL